MYFDSESVAELSDRAVRACIESRELVQQTRDILVIARADVEALRSRIDLDDATDRKWLT